MWRPAIAIGLAIAGLAYGLRVGYMAVILAGGGHGWGAAIVTGLGVFLLPVLGFAVPYRDQRLGRILLVIVTVGMLAIDCMLLVTASNEPRRYLDKAWAVLGYGYWLQWLGLWLAWQVAVLVMGILAIRRKGSSTSKG